MRFGSLFSGIGGFDLGFEQAGLSCEWEVEIDRDCQKVLAKRFPNVTRYTDVKDVGKLPTVDVICGGFPCQDLSVAGQRKGLAGERSGLWFEFLRIIECNRPRWVVIENVPGLLSSWSPVELPPDAMEGCEWDVEENSDFEIILTGLSELGYCVASRVLDAQYDGVAQRRERVFIVGSLGDGSCAEILFESESVSWNPPTRREAGPGVTPILEAGARTNGDGQRDGDGIGVEGDPMFTLQRGKQHAVAATIKQRGRDAVDEVMDNLQVSMPLKAKANSSHNEGHETYVTHALRSEGADASEDGTGRGTPLVLGFTPSSHADYREGLGTIRANGGDNGGGSEMLIAFSSKDHGADAGEIAPTLRSQNFDKSHMNGGGQVAIAFQQDATDKFSTELAPTMRGKSNGGNRAYGVASGFGVRRLTPRECERLQGFPDDWTLYDANGKEISDSARYRMLGNAVCVNVAEWIGKRILMSLSEQPPSSRSGVLNKTDIYL